MTGTPTEPEPGGAEPTADTTGMGDPVEADSEGGDDG